ncbi:hypothetical protein GCM10022277_26080 [Litoribacillus peritrichatus]|uniref:Uncharacterized protein n=2 Tax=Litoribacillus peritrichatus TaxID=718191 RepID=A0ABP7MRC2_9GAMM
MKVLHARVSSLLLIFVFGVSSVLLSEQVSASSRISSYSNENSTLVGLSERTNFKLLHQLRGGIDLVAPNGAVSPNQDGMKYVAAQREALWLIRNGIIHASADLVSKGVLAFDYAFKFQTKDGYFENGMGASPEAAVGADAFFLYSFCYAYLLLEKESAYSQQFNKMKYYKKNVENSVAWIAKNQDELFRQDRHTPNRLLFDAMAFYFAGKILRSSEYQDLGKTFINHALEAQRADGAFLEKGGHDSSYQGVCILNLSMLSFHVKGYLLKRDIAKAIKSSAAWMVSRINADGEISAEGNTRTGLGQEEQSGKLKDINYPEVALSLYYAASILEKTEYADKADAVVQYAISR